MEWQHGLTAALTMAVMAGFAAYARKQPPLAEGKAELAYPPVMRGFLWFATAFFAAGVGYCCWALLGGATEPKDVRGAMLGLPLSLLLLVPSYCERRVALQMDLEGIRGRTSFRGQRAIAWADVVAVTWSRGNYWWKLRDRHGNTLRLSGFLRGQEAIVAMLQAKVPERVWTKAVAAWRQMVRS